MSRKLKWKPSAYLATQWAFLWCVDYISAFVGGLGSGKTYIFLRKTLKLHVNKKGVKGKSHGFIGYPTFALAEELFVGPFQEMLESRGIKYTYNISKHTFKTRYGQINIGQLVTPGRIVGSSYTFAGFDEFDIGLWKNCHTAFTKIIGRMRGCEDPEIYFVTSPEGTHYTHKIFVTDNPDGERKLFRAKTTENKHLPESYVPNLRKNYDEKMIQAYIDGLFVNLTQGAVYHAFGPHNIKPITLDPRLPLVVMCDFNRGAKPMCWNIGQVVSLQKDEELRIKWSLRKTYTNTETMCEYLDSFLKEKEMEHEGKLPSLDFYGDYSGHTNTSNSSVNDWEIIERHFSNIAHRVTINTKATKSVRNGVTAVNSRLKNSKGEIRIFIDPEADHLIRDYELTVWDDAGMKEDQSNDERSHAVSAVRYFVDKEYPLRQGITRY